MPSCSLNIINERGLHARAASKLVDLTKTYACDINLVYAGKSVDAKSIMAVLMLGAACGTELLVETSGEDEEHALQAVATLFGQGFGELEAD
ncbi:MAG: HPr family phosphocarrier protein [Pseudomonadota bacterium]